MICTRAKIKSKTYPEGETTTPTLITNADDKDFCFNALYQNIRDTGKIIQLELLKCLKEKSNIERTFILPTDKNSTKTLQGIVMLPKLKEFALLDSITH